MKLCNMLLKYSIYLILILYLTACTAKQAKDIPAETEKIDKQDPPSVTLAPPVPEAASNQLPVRYQQPTYLVENEIKSSNNQSLQKEAAIKVGANITSTRGQQPLWDIMKRLAKLKKMSISWASDVDQMALVDVDIRANDDFFQAIDNLLRQKDYYHEVQGTTIIVKYKETRQYHIAIPFMRQAYMTVTGGNFLATRDSGNGTEGTVKIASNQNEVDIWANIKLNLDTILGIWTGRRASERLNTRSTDLTFDESGKITKKKVAEKALDAKDITGSEVKGQASGKGETTTNRKESNAISTVNNAATGTKTGSGEIQGSAESVSSTEKYKKSLTGTYTIDEHLGLIAVTAPRPLLKKVENYLNNLKKNIYRQVTIEAKIIEVYLKDNSKIGLDWSTVLKDFNLRGIVEFGTGGALGQVYPQVDRPNKDGSPGYAPFLSKVSMAAAPFNLMLNALNEQGDARVLSNPKLTCINGQPSLLSVGTDVTYIKEITSDVTAGTSITTSYSVTTDSVVEGVALGVVPSILDEDTVILHLTPITTEIVGGSIPERRFGQNNELIVGLPEIRYREMSTMVEVKNGEMLIIGGLIDSTEGKTEDFAPILGDIPVIRYLFGVEEKKMEKRELVILLTPRVI